MTHGDRGGAGLLLDDLELETRRLVALDGRERRDSSRTHSLLPLGKLRDCRLQALLDFGGVIARDAHYEVLARVMLGDEALHVIEGDRFDSGDGAKGGVAVRSTAIDDVLQMLFAELFLVVGTEVLLERVELRILETLEVF